MKKRTIIVAAAIAVVGLAAPARALFGPLPVVDVQGEGTWLRQLAQELAQGESLKNILAASEQHLIPTSFPWPLGSHGPLQAQPILIAAEAQLAVAVAKIQANTGAPPVPDQATILAQQGMAQIPADTADIDAAKVASDNAEGDLSAQQVQHRFDAIGLKQQQSALQLAYVQQLQKASDEAAVAAWMTQPDSFTTMGSDSAVPASDNTVVTSTIPVGLSSVPASNLVPTAPAPPIALAPIATATPASTGNVVPPPSGNALWNASSPYTIASSSDGQCGSPIVSGNSVTFNLTRGGGCYRNQLNPANNRLTTGQQYTWAFNTTTNMGVDTQGSQRLIWQIHDMNSPPGDSPITVLGIQNLNGKQVWYASSGGQTWTGPYTEGGTDSWKIVADPSTGSNGSFQLYRNGAPVFSHVGQTVATTQNGAPWWNIGPYQWDWKTNAAPGQNSNLSQVGITFNGMRFSQ